MADAWTVARRDLIHWFRQPFGIIVTLLFPVMLVLMFGYLFGGAISLPGGTPRAAETTGSSWCPACSP